MKLWGGGFSVSEPRAVATGSSELKGGQIDPIATAPGSDTRDKRRRAPHAIRDTKDAGRDAREPHAGCVRSYGAIFIDGSLQPLWPTPLTAATRNQ
jgi:hypothetical protein